MDKPLCAKLSLMLVPLMNPESFTSDGVPHRELGKVMDIDGLIFWYQIKITSEIHHKLHISSTYRTDSHLSERCLPLHLRSYSKSPGHRPSPQGPFPRCIMCQYQSIQMRRTQYRWPYHGGFGASDLDRVLAAVNVWLVLH